MPDPADIAKALGQYEQVAKMSMLPMHTLKVCITQKPSAFGSRTH